MFLLLFLWVLIDLPYYVAPSVIERRAISGGLYNSFKLYEQYAAAAYCTNNNDATPGTVVTCGPGICPEVQAAGAVSILEFENSEVTDVTGFVATDPANRLIVVAFRGSVSVRNFITDANFPLIPTDICDGCLGEAGFYSSWLEARDRVMSVVMMAASANPSFKVVATGHSLGGAIATFAAAELRNEGFPVDLCIFGSPRVGDTTTANYTTAQTPSMGQNYRITHYNDPIPRLPPILFGYNHIAPEYYISTPNNAAATANDIQVYQGVGNKGGNGAWILTDILAHGWYFNAIGGCIAPGFEWKS